MRKWKQTRSSNVLLCAAWKALMRKLELELKLRYGVDVLAEAQTRPPPETLQFDSLDNDEEVENEEYDKLYFYQPEGKRLYDE